MIQIALVGRTPVVVEYGLRKFVPTKLFVLHTENQSDYQYESEANRFREKIENEYNIPVILRKVGAFDMKGIINTILNIIMKEKGSTSENNKNFAINITGGTKLMVAAASTAAYLAGSKLYYVMESTKYRGDDPVIELPLPARPINDNRGNTSKNTAIILQKIKEQVESNNSILIHEIQNDKRLKKKPRIQYHLDKLRDLGLIKIEQGWKYPRTNKRTKLVEIVTDYKKRTIRLTPTGEYYAEFPGLIDDLIK
jgi:Family of unknown function (DUF6293)